MMACNMCRKKMPHYHAENHRVQCVGCGVIAPFSVVFTMNGEPSLSAKNLEHNPEVINEGFISACRFTGRSDGFLPIYDMMGRYGLSFKPVRVFPREAMNSR